MNRCSLTFWDVTSRIVTKEDVENVLLAIRKAYEDEEIDQQHYLNYRVRAVRRIYRAEAPINDSAIVGSASLEMRSVRKSRGPDILPNQDKIRMQHYCPLHQQVVEGVTPLLEGRLDNELMFKQLSFERWLRQQKVPLMHCSPVFLPGDLRKVCEQMAIYCSGISQTRTTY